MHAIFDHRYVSKDAIQSWIDVSRSAVKRHRQYEIIADYSTFMQIQSFFCFVLSPHILYMFEISFKMLMLHYHLFWVIEAQSTVIDNTLAIPS